MGVRRRGDAGGAGPGADRERPAQPKAGKRRARPDPFLEPPRADTFPAHGGRDFFWYELVHQSRRSRARVGRIHTPHGVVDTPNFVAVGTNAALKAVDHSLADGLGLQLMFANTYHLLLQPGPEVVERAGGLHRFMRRDRPIITDSGGFQVFSLSNNSVTDELNRKKSAGKYSTNSVAKVSEAGVVFRSYRDGRLVELTPERTVRTQKALGADIIIPLDELPPYHIDRADLKRSVYLSHRWEGEYMQLPRREERRTD